jgi:hypothetical protein
MEIFKLLEQSNCRECGEETCLAFAAAVARGDRKIGDCPRLGERLQQQLEEQSGEVRSRGDQDLDAILQGLKRQIAGTDLHEAAERLGGELSGNRLSLKVLGSDFSVDASGDIKTKIHINPWIVAPILDYIANGQGRNPQGRWVPFRELKNGQPWYPLFRQRCEKPMKKVADAYPSLFRDILDVFQARRAEGHFEADIAAVLHPLPKVPILICYWLPEEELESSLNLFFDVTATDNLGIESVNGMGSGLAKMVEQIALRHATPQDEAHG